jgi:hypothetical protein
MRGVMRFALLLIALTGWTCSSRRAGPATQQEEGSGAVAGAREGHKGDRVVRLSSVGTDTTCLEKAGGTVVPAELSDADVRTIEALIRKVDALPIVRIGQPTFGGGWLGGGAPELEGMTGVECGALSGHGTVYRITRVDGKWRVTVSGEWAA